MCSGGHWDYLHLRIKFALEDICEDIQERFPKLSKKISSVNKELSDILHDIDYDLCGDTIIKDDRKFEANALKKLGVRNGKTRSKKT